ncbi:hypothetical protein [Robertkochia marina]|uniref:hypothetical protein n=1 Tax=Robertkochia marina TaxID=1227945 RepID=UPI001454C83E|nr:hypothetical protein [Robertkochia marina]
MVILDIPQGVVNYIYNPFNVREDYPDMQFHVCMDKEARLAVAEFIVSLKE